MQVPPSSEGGDDRPTFFELVAADKLVPSLRAALLYSVGVLVSRRPSLARLLDHEDEAFALFMLLVEWHSFATSDGSLAEGLYGLQRTRARKDFRSHPQTPRAKTAIHVDLFASPPQRWVGHAFAFPKRPLVFHRAVTGPW